MKRLGIALAAFGLGVAFAPPVASAGGLEFPAPGTVSLGRGGASFARPGDPMALLYNPANLAGMQGIQLSLQTHLAFYDACFQREGTYQEYSAEPGMADRNNGNRIRRVDEDPTFIEASAFNAAGAYPDAQLPEVCNSGPPGIVPELILTWRAHRKVGIGIGFVAPAAVGHTVWGGDTTIGDRTYRGTVNGLPAPSRYGLVEEQLIVAFPTIGVGVNVHPRLRIGVAFGSGFGFFDFTNVTRAVQGEDFAGDIFTELSASDPFIPKITASVHAIPHDNLDISLTFSWTDTVRAEGDIKLTTGYYRETPVDELTIPGAVLEAPQPWQIALGIRYADRISPRTDNPDQVARLSRRVEDPMSNERFDIELNVVYERNSVVNEFGVTMPQCDMATGATCQTQADGSSAFVVNAAPFTPAPIPASLTLAHNWQDSLSVRLGGDYNVMPGLAAIRLGFSFESKGVEDGYEQLDFMPFMRFGAHIGLTMRLGFFDISLAYAHIQQVETTVSVQNGQITQVHAEETFADLQDRESVAGHGTIINAGRYRSNFDVVSLGLTYHFR
jgi:hypothetical protein